MNWRASLIPFGSMLALLSIAQAGATESATGVEIEVSYKALFRGGLLQGFEANWLFDPSLSKMILKDFDTNRDGVFDRAEIVELNKASLPTLHENGFFTNLIIDQKETSLIAITGIKASNERGRIRYRFSLGISEGEIDVRGKEVIAHINDPTTITTILPAKNGAAHLETGAPSGCKIRAEQKDILVTHYNWRSDKLSGQLHSLESVTTIYLICKKIEVVQP